MCNALNKVFFDELPVLAIFHVMFVGEAAHFGFSEKARNCPNCGGEGRIVRNTNCWSEFPQKIIGFWTVHKCDGSHTTGPVLPRTNPYRPIPTQYHQVPSSTALYWPSTIVYQLVLLHTDPLPPSTKQFHPILTQNHQVPTRTALYWPSNTKYQEELPNTYPFNGITIIYQPVCFGEYTLLHSLPWV